MRAPKSLRSALLLCTAPLLIGIGGGDPVLDNDPIDPRTGRPAEIVPGTLRLDPGRDGRFGTGDDVFGPEYGDVDIIVRTGLTSFEGAVPLPATYRPDGVPTTVAGIGGLAGLAGGIEPLRFAVAMTDGELAVNPPVVTPYLAGMPVLVMAFADADGDGYIGVTHSDGDTSDAAREEAELIPVARRLAFFGEDVAGGVISLGVGGPAASPVRIALTAVAYMGPRHADFHEGAIPDGPLVMTKLPFLPRSGIKAVFGGGGVGGPGGPNEPFEADLEPLVVPNPTIHGEAYTLMTNGGQLSTDVAIARSGPVVRYGVVREVDTPYHGVQVRRGLRENGEATAVQVPPRLSLADDGDATSTELRIVPLDQLENVTDPRGWRLIRVTTTGGLRIVSPDIDADPQHELVPVFDARGTAIVVDDSGGAFDDADDASLLIEEWGGSHPVAVTFADPDVDDSLQVDETDRDLVRALRDTNYGEPGFAPRYDLNGDGMIDGADFNIVSRSLGMDVPAP